MNYQHAVKHLVTSNKLNDGNRHRKPNQNGFGIRFELVRMINAVKNVKIIVNAATEETQTL